MCQGIIFVIYLPRIGIDPSAFAGIFYFLVNMQHQGQQWSSLNFFDSFSFLQVGGQAVLGRQLQTATPWLTERHGYDPTWELSS